MSQVGACNSMWLDLFLNAGFQAAERRDPASHN